MMRVARYNIKMMYQMTRNNYPFQICYAELPKYTLISKESHNIINKEMSHSIHMQHFIPNIVVVPIKNPSFFEIEWEWIKIGDTIIKNINPWGR